MNATPGNYSDSLDRNSEGTPCRLCMKKNDYYYNIFTSIVASQITVEDALYDLVDLKVAVGDGLPATLCPLCLKKLIEFNDFRNICHKSDAELRTFSSRDYFRFPVKEENEDQLSEGNHPPLYTSDPVGISTDASDPLASDYLISDDEEGYVVNDCSDGATIKQIHQDSSNQKADALNGLLGLESIQGKEAADGKLGTPAETNSCIRDVIEGTTHLTCPVQRTEIYIPMLDSQQLRSNMLVTVKDENKDPLGEGNYPVMETPDPDGISSNALDPLATDDLCHVKVENNESQREENNQILHGTTPNGIESDAIYPLATDNLFHVKEENMDPLREENGEVLYGTAPDGIESDAIDPLAIDELSGRGACMSSSVKVDKSGDDEEEYDCTDWASNDLMPHASADQRHSLTASRGKEVDDEGRGVVLTDLDWKLIEAKKEPSPEESDAAKPTLNENGEFIENLAIDVESTVGAAGLPAPERSQMKASSPSYLLALGDVRTDEKYGRIPPSTTVTCIQFKSEASHAEEGRNVIDKELRKCSTLIHGEGTSCLFPSDGQSYTKDMQASKISGVGTKKSFVVVGCDALDATNTLGCIETREKADSGNEAVMGENEESSNYLIKNPGNSCRSNESSYHFLSTRDGFNSKDEVSKHLQTNLGARNVDGDAELSDYSCRICEKCFFRIDHLNEHMRSHVGDKPYVCDVCSKYFSSKKNLGIHCRTHTGERPFSCSICCKSFYQSCDVTRHMRTHTMEKPYACSICCNRFSQSSGLVKHMLGHTGGKPYSCDVCSKAFPKKRDLIMHGRTHAGEKPYPCDVCSKSFSTKKQLAIHCRTHTRGKPYSCDVCNKSFSTKSYFVVHCRTHTGWKPYSCDVCNKSLSSKNRLVVHCRTHSGEKPYACSICCKSFCERSVLTKHMHTHSGERPYSCNVCSKSFSQLTGLNNHMRIHSGEKPYSCNVCSKSFNQTCNLYAHMLTHSGEKPFSCDVCNKAFSRKDNLVTHTRAHTGERPYSCSICRKSFYQSSGVTRHMRTHTGEKPFSCDVCKKPFLKKSELDIHCRTHT